MVKLYGNGQYKKLTLAEVEQQIHEEGSTMYSGDLSLWEQLADTMRENLLHRFGRRGVGAGVFVFATG